MLTDRRYRPPTTVVDDGCRRPGLAKGRTCPYGCDRLVTGLAGAGNLIEYALISPGYWRALRGIGETREDRPQRENRLTLLFITRNFSVAEYLSNTMAVIYREKVAENGKTPSICYQAGYRYAEEVLNAVPRFDQVQLT